MIENLKEEVLESNIDPDSILDFQLFPRDEKQDADWEKKYHTTILTIKNITFEELLNIIDYEIDISDGVSGINNLNIYTKRNFIYCDLQYDAEDNCNHINTTFVNRLLPSEQDGVLDYDLGC